MEVITIYKYFPETLCETAEDFTYEERVKEDEVVMRLEYMFSRELKENKVILAGNSLAYGNGMTKSVMATFPEHYKDKVAQMLKRCKTTYLKTLYEKKDLLDAEIINLEKELAAEVKYDLWTKDVSELKAMLYSNNQLVDGNKDELVARIKDSCLGGEKSDNYYPGYGRY